MLIVVFIREEENLRSCRLSVVSQSFFCVIWLLLQRSLWFDLQHHIQYHDKQKDWYQDKFRKFGARIKILEEGISQIYDRERVHVDLDSVFIPWTVSFYFESVSKMIHYEIS